MGRMVFLALKRSRLDHWYQRHVIALVLLQISFVLFLAIAYCLFLTTADQFWFLNYVDISDARYTGEFFVVFGRVMLMFTFYIPITLLLTLEIIRILLAQFVVKDETMKDKKDSSSVRANDVTVIEDLGCVSHIFSDKTGTLTQNLMTFAAIALPGPIRVSSLKEEANDDEDDDTWSNKSERETLSNSPTFCDPYFPLAYIFQRVQNSEESETELAQLIFIMAVCLE